MSLTQADPDRAAEARSLVTLLDETLNRLVAAFEQSGVTLPDRRYWTLADPAEDCEQVVVSFVQAYIGSPGDEASLPANCQGPRSAALDIRVTRCTPTIRANRAPKPSEIQAASEQLAIDAYLLLDVAADLDSWASPFPGGLGVIATVDAITASGGMQSVVMHLAMAIP